MCPKQEKKIRKIMKISNHKYAISDLYLLQIGSKKKSKLGISYVICQNH